MEVKKRKKKQKNKQVAEVNNNLHKCQLNTHAGYVKMQ